MRLVDVVSVFDQVGLIVLVVANFLVGLSLHDHILYFFILIELVDVAVVFRFGSEHRLIRSVYN